jgi:hypothetical protein
MLQGFLQYRLTPNISTVVITIWYANTTLHWVECCLMCFITFAMPFWHINFDYRLLRLPNLELWLTAGMTGQQGMLTTPPILCTWSHLRCFQESVFAQSSRFIFHTGFITLITVRYITLSLFTISALQGNITYQTDRIN